jgi:predicted acyltransferase
LSITHPNSIPPKKPQRLQSLDALRGFDMFWIISGEGIFHGLANVVKAKHSLVQSSIDWQIASTAGLSFLERISIGMSNQLHHTPWNGFTFYDMIFPLFIFIAGVSMPYSYGYKLENAKANKSIVKRNIYASLIKRTIILIVLGMIVNGLLQWQGYENTRFASVLGRIALSCFFAAIIFLNNNLRGQITWFIAILLGYWAAMELIPVPSFGAGNLSPEGNLAAYVDQHFLPGKLHRKVYDPEGLLSTVPAIASALLGVFAGSFLRWQSNKFTMIKKASSLLLAGIVLVLLGWLWGLVFPINKNMWTSSFVLFAGGWSTLLLSVFYLIIDVFGYQKWSMPFVWIGVNSILIYVGAHGMMNFESISHFLFGGFINCTAAIWHPPLLWIGVALIQISLLYFLYKKKWFLKI